MLHRVTSASCGFAMSLFVLIGTPVSAQIVGLTPEESVLVERYIVDEATLPPPVVIEENTTLRPGSAVPVGVQLQSFGGRTNLAKYAYFVSVDGKVVVVDPETRIVARIFAAKK